MPSMKMPSASDVAVAAFESLVPAHPAVTRRKMFGHPAAFVQGNMFFGVFGEALVLKLSASDCASALRVPGVTDFEPMPGRAMRDWVSMGPAMFPQRAVLEKWVDKALAAGLQLPPKGAKPARGTPKAAPGRSRSGR